MVQSHISNFEKSPTKISIRAPKVSQLKSSLVRIFPLKITNRTSGL